MEFKLQPLREAGNTLQAQEARVSLRTRRAQGLQHCMKEMGLKIFQPWLGEPTAEPCGPWVEVRSTSCREPWKDVYFGKII